MLPMINEKHTKKCSKWWIQLIYHLLENSHDSIHTWDKLSPYVDVGLVFDTFRLDKLSSSVATRLIIKSSFRDSKELILDGLELLLAAIDIGLLSQTTFTFKLLYLVGLLLPSLLPIWITVFSSLLANLPANEKSPVDNESVFADDQVSPCWFDIAFNVIVGIAAKENTFSWKCSHVSSLRAKENETILYCD